MKYNIVACLRTVKVQQNIGLYRKLLKISVKKLQLIIKGWGTNSQEMKQKETH